MQYLQFNIRLLREQSKLTQKELEDALGLTRGVLSSYEKGTAAPRLKNLIQLVNFFKIEYPDLTIDSLINEKLSRSMISNNEEVKVNLNNLQPLETEIKLLPKNSPINEKNLEIISKNKNIDESFKILIAQQIVFGS